MSRWSHLSTELHTFYTLLPRLLLQSLPGHRTLPYQVSHSQTVKLSTILKPFFCTLQLRLISIIIFLADMVFYVNKVLYCILFYYFQITNLVFRFTIIYRWNMQQNIYDRKIIGHTGLITILAIAGSHGVTYWEERCYILKYNMLTFCYLLIRGWLFNAEDNLLTYFIKIKCSYLKPLRILSEMLNLT